MSRPKPPGCRAFRKPRRPTPNPVGMIFWLAVLWLSGCSGPEPQGRPNVILVSVDTLRADRLSVYGYGRPTSPNLERLAADAVVFENFVNNGGGTLPSHLTMMTSLYPAVHGVDPGNGRALAVEETTLAEHLRRAGYATGAFVDSGWMRGRFGFFQGFDLYDDPGGGFEAILPKALDWLHRNRDRRFFLFLHTYDVHSKSERLPYDCPGEFSALYASMLEVEFDGCRERGCASQLLALWNEDIKAGRLRAHDVLREEEIAYISALYDGCINYADDQLGRLFRELEELGLYDPTLIVITSDHGEQFAEHGLFMHTEGGYEEIVRIPLIAKLPYSRAGGLRVPHLVAMVDVMPSILEIAGLDPSERTQGLSFLPTISRGESIRQATTIGRAVRTSSWKYLEDPRELFDLETDPAESVNLAARQPETVDRLDRYLQSQLEKYQDLHREQGSETDKLELSSEEVRQLQALGYLN